MAGKARRAAARQGELSRRRKRTQRGPSGVPAVPAQQQNDLTVAVANDAADTMAIQPQAEQAAATAAPAVAPRPAQVSAPQRFQGRQRGERPAAYNYVGAELRRIAMLSTVVIAALVVLSVVL